MTVPPDVNAYFRSVAPHASNELRLYERVASTLQGLRYEDAASRKATAAALLGLHTQIAPLAAAASSIRPPARLAAAHESRIKTIKHMAAATEEIARALNDDSSSRSKRAAIARHEAAAAEASARTGANAVTASLGAVSTSLAAVPVVGQIIAAVLMVIAAVLLLIAQISAKAKEEQAAKKEGGPEPKRKGDD
jgi:hypothetical protein